MRFDIYRLPDGSLVATDASATRSLPVIDYTLKGGAIVQATLVQAAPKETWA